MRTYPRNSPEAATRIVALALLADGHLCHTEIELLDRLGAKAELGMDRTGLHAVVQALCEDLLVSMHGTWGSACQVDPCTMAAVLAEIDEHELRLKVVRLCAAVVAADKHVSDAESMLVNTAVEQWGLQREMFEPAPRCTEVV
jgi:uncharacterized tellurite resistance protein B-like protein